MPYVKESPEKIMAINEIIAKRLEALESYLSRLYKYKTTPKSEFLSKWEIQDIILRNFQVAIECCIDIAMHIISIKKLKTPESYVDAIEILKEKKILSDDLAEKLIDFTKFRNIIVHEYLYIDFEKVYKNLQGIEVLRNYIERITNYLSKEKNRRYHSKTKK